MLAASSNEPFSLFRSEPAHKPRWLLGPLQHYLRAPSAFSSVLNNRRRRSIELAIARRRGCVGVDLARADIDRILIDLGQRRGAKIADRPVQKTLVPAIIQITQRGFGEGSGSATTVDGLSEDFGLALGADLLGDLFVVSASTFLNADAAEGAAEDPVGRFGA